MNEDLRHEISLRQAKINFMREATEHAAAHLELQSGEFAQICIGVNKDVREYMDLGRRTVDRFFRHKDSLDKVIEQAWIIMLLDFMFIELDAGQLFLADAEIYEYSDARVRLEVVFYAIDIGEREGLLLPELEVEADQEENAVPEPQPGDDQQDAPGPEPEVEAAREETAAPEPEVEAALEETAAPEPEMEAARGVNAIPEPQEAQEEAPGPAEAAREENANPEPQAEAVQEEAPGPEPQAEAAQEENANPELQAEAAREENANPEPQVEAAQEETAAPPPEVEAAQEEAPGLEIEPEGVQEEAQGPEIEPEEAQHETTDPGSDTNSVMSDQGANTSGDTVTRNNEAPADVSFHDSDDDSDDIDEGDETNDNDMNGNGNDGNDINDNGNDINENDNDNMDIDNHNGDNTNDDNNNGNTNNGSDSDSDNNNNDNDTHNTSFLGRLNGRFNLMGQGLRFHRQHLEALSHVKSGAHVVDDSGDDDLLEDVLHAIESNDTERQEGEMETETETEIRQSPAPVSDTETQSPAPVSDTETPQSPTAVSDAETQRSPTPVPITEGLLINGLAPPSLPPPGLPQPFLAPPEAHSTPHHTRRRTREDGPEPEPIPMTGIADLPPPDDAGNARSPIKRARTEAEAPDDSVDMPESVSEAASRAIGADSEDSIAFADDEDDSDGAGNNSFRTADGDRMDVDEPDVGVDESAETDSSAQNSLDSQSTRNSIDSQTSLSSSNIKAPWAPKKTTREQPDFSLSPIKKENEVDESPTKAREGNVPENIQTILRSQANAENVGMGTIPQLSAPTNTDHSNGGSSRNSLASSGATGTPQRVNQERNCARVLYPGYVNTFRAVEPPDDEPEMTRLTPDRPFWPGRPLSISVGSRRSSGVSTPTRSSQPKKDNNERKGLRRNPKRGSGGYDSTRG